MRERATIDEAAAFDGLRPAWSCGRVAALFAVACAPWFGVPGWTGIAERLALPAWLADAGLPASAHAQDRSVVTVDESPTARLLLQQLIDQRRDNVGEAARLAQRLLEEFGASLVPSEGTDRDGFTSVRRRVESLLREDADLLERWRALATPAAERLLADGSYAEVLASRSLTRPGLLASVALAERAFDDGRLASAIALADEALRHPDIDLDDGEAARARAFRALIAGAAAHFLGDDERAALERARLASVEGVDAPRALARLDTILAGTRPIREETIDGIAPGDAQLEVGSSWHRVWEFAMRESASRATLDGPTRTMRALGMLGSDFDRAARLTGLPMVADDLVLVSNGASVRAHDRFGASLRWSRSLGTRVDRLLGAASDLGGLARAGDVVIALSGTASLQERTGGSRLIALALADGERLWATDLPQALDALMPSSASAGSVFAYGAPVVVDDTVIVAMRRLNNRREIVDWLVAIDVIDGSPRWARLLGSSGGVRLTRPLSQPITDGPDVLLASPAGVVTCLRAATGEIRWLRRFPVPLDPGGRETVPWEISTPLITPRGLLAVVPNGRDVALFDREDGRVIEQWPIGPGTEWGDVRYLLAARATDGTALIVAVGSDVVALPLADPARALWRLGDSAAGIIDEWVGASDRNGVRGRVHAVRDLIVVPGTERVLLVDASSGAGLQEIETTRPTNPVVADEQLVLASTEDVVALMQFGPAERVLRERMREDPSDVSRPLGLLALALQAHRPELGIEAGLAAFDALEQRDDPGPTADSRGELFDRLLALALDERNEDDSTAARLLELAERAASRSDQSARLALATGERATRAGRIDDALDAWRSVLGDETLGQATVRDELREERASLVALTRLEALRAGDPRARLRDEAAAGAALAGTTPDLDAIAANARWRGTDAHRALANEIAANDATSPDTVRGVFDPTDVLFDRDFALARARAMSRAGWRRDAVRVLDSLLQTAGDEPGFDERVARARAEIVGAGAGSTPLDRATAIDPTRGPVPPVIGRPAFTAIELPGRLLRKAPGLRIPADVGIGLLVDQRLAWRPRPDAEPLWSVRLDDRDPLVLACDEETILLWEEQTLDLARPLELSLADGSLVWAGPPASQVLAPFLPGVDQLERTRPGGGSFQPRRVTPILLDDRIVLVRGSGEIAAISRGDGAVAWSLDRVLDVIYEVSAIDSALVVAGRGTARDADGGLVRVPAVVVLDPATGERLNAIVPTGLEEIRWLRADPRGVVLLGTLSGVESYPIAGSDVPLWRNDEVVGDAIDARIVGDRVVMLDRTGALASLRLRDGRRDVDRFPLPEGDWLQNVVVGLDVDPDGVRVLYKERLVRYDASGAIVGVDAISGDRQYVATAYGRRADLVLDELGLEQSDNRSFYRYALHRFDRSSGLRLLDDSLEVKVPGVRLDRVELRRNWVLAVGRESVIALPTTAD